MSGPPEGDPGALRVLAAVLLRTADEVQSIADRAAEEADSSSWSAPRADRFRSDVGALRGGAYGASGTMRALAAKLEQVARHLEGELSVLDRLEFSARAVLGDTAQAIGFLAPLAYAGWSPAHLPPPRDPAWREIAAILGIP